MSLLMVFATATAIVVGAVYALYALEGWWLLGLATAIHLLMALAVMWAVWRTLSRPDA